MSKKSLGGDHIVKFLKGLRNGGISAKTKNETHPVVQPKPHFQVLKEMGYKPLPYDY